MEIIEILKAVEAGTLSSEKAAELMSQGLEHDIGFARVDIDRFRRRGLPEVIFCPGKTAEQICSIMAELVKSGQNVLATRVSREQSETIRKVYPESEYNETSRTIVFKNRHSPDLVGLVTVVCAGTSDLPVAEEAAVAAECAGANVMRINDVGVAGLHRVLRHLDTFRSSRAVVVVAGMEGALPSVVAGLIDKPVIAVPTSVGYGSGFKGVAALLAMLNSCVPGISVVNIDNGFGAGISAAFINRLGEH